jgi:hypothetical protein
MSPATIKIVGAVAAAVFAGAAVYFPQYATELGALSTYILGAIFHPRPGDVKAAPKAE